MLMQERTHERVIFIRNVAYRCKNYQGRLPPISSHIGHFDHFKHTQANWAFAHHCVITVSQRYTE